MKKLYVYSNATYLAKGWIKVGQSSSPEKRTKSGKTYTPEKLEILKVYDLPEKYQDHDIHRALEDAGHERIEKGGGREWFSVSLKDVDRAFNSVTKKISRAYDFNLRSEQREAVEKAIGWFKTPVNKKLSFHPERFLLNAKMRFGKCFTGIHIAKKLLAKETLIVTYKPEVLGEWLDIVNEHVEFKDMSGIRARKINDNEELYIKDDGTFPKCSNNIVVCVSMQDFELDKEDNICKKRLSKLVDKKWDLIIFDEVHYGSMTPRARKIFDSLKYKKRLDLSGTPFRLLEMEDFCKEQIFTYSYLDEQEKKKAEAKNIKSEVVYRVFPDIDISTIEITEEDLQNQLNIFSNEDLELSLNKLFEAKNNKFLHNQAVDHFIEKLTIRDRKASSISVYGALSLRLGLPVKRHSVWWVSSVSSANAFHEKLKEHPYFKNFEIINAAGAGRNAKSELDLDVKIAKEKRHVVGAINRSVNNDKSYGTITITVKRFLTGVTIKEWDSILVLNDTESPEEYYQAIFRIQSPWVDDLSGKVVKGRSWVFDFSVTRCLMMKIPLADAIASERLRKRHLEQTSSDELKKATDELCSGFSLKSYVDGELEANYLTSKEVFAAINIGAARASLARRITSDALIDSVPLYLIESDPSILKILESIKGYRTQTIGSATELVKIGKLERDRQNSSSTGSGKKGANSENSDFNKEQKKVRERVRTQIKRLAISMSDFIYMTLEREHCVGQVLETKEAKFFTAVTGITKEDFKKLCDCGFIKKDKLNSIVRDFYHQEFASLNSDKYVFSFVEAMVNKKAA